MIRSLFHAGVGPATLLAIVSSASAGFTANVTIGLQYSNYNGSFSYQLSPFIYGSGFTDNADPGNVLKVTSPNGVAYAMPTVAGPGSFGSLSDLIDEVTAGPWSIEITDGVTAEMRTFAFDVTIDAGLTEDYFRAVTPVGFGQGSVIPQSPNFQWDVEPAAIPEAEFDSTIPSIQGAAFEFGSVAANATMWTPTIAPLPPGPGYLFALFERNYGNAPFDLVTFSDTLATDGGDELDDASPSFFTGSQLIITDLEVVPTPGTLGLASIAGLAVVRRRRR